MFSFLRNTFFLNQGLFNFRLSTRSDSMYEIIYYFPPRCFHYSGREKSHGKHETIILKSQHKEKAGKAATHRNRAR